jgi:hypothetical protein
MTMTRNIKLANKNTDYYWCCEVRNHPSTRQDGHSWGPVQILDQSGPRPPKSRYWQDATKYRGLRYHVSLSCATSSASLFLQIGTTV